MGVPGWPELACSTASIESTRIELMTCQAAGVETGGRVGWLTSLRAGVRIGWGATQDNL